MGLNAIRLEVFVFRVLATRQYTLNYVKGKTHEHARVHERSYARAHTHARTHARTHAHTHTHTHLFT